MDKLDDLLLTERVIGAAMTDASVMERLARAGVAPAEFEVGEHQQIWKACITAFGRFGRADTGLVEEILRRDARMPGDEARRWIKGVVDSSHMGSVDDETLSLYVERIRHAAGMRRTRQLADKLYAAAGDGAPIVDIVAAAHRELEAIVLGSSSSRTHKARDLARRYSDRIAAGQDTAVERARIGVKSIDDAAKGGPRLGTTLVVGADTGVGKTTMAAHIILTNLNDGRGVAYYNFESDADSIWDRLVEMRAGVRYSEARTPEQWGSLAAANGWLSEAPLFVDDQESMTVEELTSKMHALVKQENIKVVLVDYVQDIERSTRHQRDDLNFIHISKALRRAAARLRILLVEFAQLTDEDDRGGSPRNKKKQKDDGPSEKALAFTKQWAKDASYILMLDRLKDSDDDVLRNLTRSRLVKHRFDGGTLVKTWMRWDVATTKLYESDGAGNRLDEMKATPTTTVEATAPVASDGWSDAVADADADD